MSRLVLHLSAEARRTLGLAVARARHREACGLCLGTVRGTRLHVAAVCVTRNNSASPTAFSIDAGEWNRGSRLARTLGLAPVAVFHSHPDGSIALSDADRRGLTRSSLPWLVVASHGGRLRVGLHEREAAPAPQPLGRSRGRA